MELAGQIAEKSVAITPYAMRAVLAPERMPLGEGLRFEHAITVEAIATEDRMEGLRAFAEKRPPRFLGR